MMKKFLTIALMSSFSALFGQITINSSDMPQPDDTVRMSIGLNTENFDFAAGGENYLWDFSELNPLSQRVDTFLTVTQTPVTFWPFYIGSANLVAPFNPAQIVAGLPDAKGYRFIQNSTASFTDMGYGIVIDGTPLPAKYADADEIYQFPMTYGQTFESTAGLEIGVPGFGYLLIDRSRQNEVDAWGTVKTPFGTFDAIRYKSVVNEYDSIYIESTGQGTAVQRNYTEYQWLTSGGGLPILQVQLDETFGNTVMYQDSARDVNVGSHEQYTVENLKVVPNPVVDRFSIFLRSNLDESVYVTFYNVSGQVVFERNYPTLAIENQTLTFTRSEIGLIAGIYLLRIQSKSQIFQTRLLVQ